LKGSIPPRGRGFLNLPRWGKVSLNGKGEGLLTLGRKFTFRETGRGKMVEKRVDAGA